MFYSKIGEFIIAKFDHQRVLLTPDFQSYPNYTKFIKTKSCHWGTPTVLYKSAGCSRVQSPSYSVATWMWIERNVPVLVDKP
jgi:hypothetical protein